MVMFEEFRRFSVQKIGSEELYRRLDSKLGECEVDKFVYKKQLDLFTLRFEFLQMNTTFSYEKRLMCTDKFEEVLKDLESHKPDVEVSAAFCREA